MITKVDVNAIQQRTTMQVDETEWFEQRKTRLTASINNKLKHPKTERGLKTLAKNIVYSKTITNKTLQYKLNFGRYHEPIALAQYERYKKSKNHSVQIEKVGLVIDYANYVLGASPDAKIIDTSEANPYGIIEIKCSEEYKENDPRDICFISKNPCIELIENQICLKKTHSYYDQVQMQLALTTQSWCDFVLYTNKGLVIDRILYDEKHWYDLREKLLNFYLTFY